MRAWDFVAVFGSAIVVYLIYNVALLEEQQQDRYPLIAVIGALLAIILFHNAGCYDFPRLRKRDWQVQRAVGIWSLVVATGLVFAFVTKSTEDFSRAWVIGWYLAAIAFLVAGRLVVWRKINAWERQGRLARHVVVVGADALGAELIARLEGMVEENIRIIGLFDDRCSRVPKVVQGQQLLGTTDDLLRYASAAQVDEIIVALPLSAEARLHTVFDKLRRLPVDLRLSLAPLADLLLIRGISHVGSIPAIDVAERPLKHWGAVTKWLEDKLLGGLLLLVLSPLMALTALAIKLDSAGPAFFVQERFGFNNRVIRVLKFRTMYVERADPSGAQQTVRNDPRVTRLGSFLRAWSLDELPQLINVLVGDMSLVGPRPHAITMKAAGRLYYDAVNEYCRRHRVKPGITGWAQVNGLRGETDTIEKAQRRVAYDLQYIDHWSLGFDLRVLILTLRVFVTRENAY